MKLRFLPPFALTRRAVAGLFRSGPIRALPLLLALPLILFLFTLVSTADGTPLRSFFLSEGNFRFVAVQAAVPVLGALGLALVAAGRGIDLSAGPQILFSATLSAHLIPYWPGAGLVATLLVGLLLGALNGTLATASKAPLWAGTLLFGLLLHAVTALIPTPETPTPIETWMAVYPEPSWLLVAPGVWLSLALSLAMALLLRTTLFARHLLATGADEEAARLCGIPVRRTRILAFAGAGALFALAGWLEMATPSEGEREGFLLSAELLALLVIGGLSLRGGRLAVGWLLLAALTIGLWRNGVWQAGWPPPVADLGIALLALAALAWEGWREKWQYGPPPPPLIAEGPPPQVNP